jgi:hypothetical protein
MRRLLLSRWARSLAIVGAWLLTLQSLGLTQMAYAEAAADCCCKAHDAACHCPVCAHHRAVESGKPFLKSCGSTADEVAVIVLDPSLPAAEPTPAPRIGAQRALDVAPALAEAPPREVPTPPPLA